MILEVSVYMANYMSDSAGTLGVDMAADGLTFTFVGEPFTAGLVEIDDELVAVSGFDQNTGIATVPPWGRAQGGSVAVAHATNAKVTIRPRYPRYWIKYVINQVLSGVYPALFAVLTDETQVVNPTTSTYDMPAGATGILGISYESPSLPDNWIDVSRWTLDKRANLADSPTGSALQIREPMYPGRTLKIVYTGVPSPLVNGSDVYSTTTGLLPGSEDVVTLGAAARLLVGAEVMRAQPSTVEQSNRTEIVPPGAASSASKYLLALHQQRLDQERKRLRQLFPLMLRKAY